MEKKPLSGIEMDTTAIISIDMFKLVDLPWYYTARSTYEWSSCQQLPGEFLDPNGSTT